jgi:hypothetical protein
LCHVANEIHQAVLITRYHMLPVEAPFAGHISGGQIDLGFADISLFASPCFLSPSSNGPTTHQLLMTPSHSRQVDLLHPIRSTL